MQTATKFTLLAFLCFSINIYGQKEQDLPYSGGSVQFEKDVMTYLLVETIDSGRIYFVEVTYSTTKKETEFIIHGAGERDITTRLIEGFFQRIKNKWNKKFLESSNIVIPFFIAPRDIDNPSSLGKVNLDQLAKVIAGSFKSKKCFLHKPVYSFNQGINIDIESQQ